MARMVGRTFRLLCVCVCFFLLSIAGCICSFSVRSLHHSFLPLSLILSVMITIATVIIIIITSFFTRTICINMCYRSESFVHMHHAYHFECIHFRVARCRGREKGVILGGVQGRGSEQRISRAVDELGNFHLSSRDSYENLHCFITWLPLRRCLHSKMHTVARTAICPRSKSIMLNCDDRHRRTRVFDTFIRHASDTHIWKSIAPVERLHTINRTSFDTHESYCCNCAAALFRFRVLRMCVSGSAPASTCVCVQCPRLRDVVSSLSLSHWLHWSVAFALLFAWAMQRHTVHTVVYM